MTQGIAVYVHHGSTLVMSGPRTLDHSHPVEINTLRSVCITQLNPSEHTTTTRTSGPERVRRLLCYLMLLRSRNLNNDQDIYAPTMSGRCSHYFCVLK